jgi:hypothetical protein
VGAGTAAANPVGRLAIARRVGRRGDIRRGRCRARERSLDRVLLLGPTFGEAKERVLSSAPAFTVPSFSEGLSISVLEAWSFALTVVGGNLAAR